jgi:low temperature requirement protein LtrA
VLQLTELISSPQQAGDYADAALILAITWWMYDGYVWLTGNTPLERARLRLVLFAGMGGFFVMAISIPGAFGATDSAPSDTGVVFGVAYLAVTLVHIGLFAMAPNRSARAIWGISPFNVGGALLVIVSGVISADWRWVGMLAAIVLMTSSTLFRREQSFSLSASHFVERHGLVIIVALGESVVDIGLGTSGVEVDARLIAAALLGLALSASMWWVYFDRDQELAESAMHARTGSRRSRMGLWWAYTHLVMIAGIVVMSAGSRLVVADSGARVGVGDAWNLALGVSIYLVGEGAFKMVCGLGGVRRTYVAAAAMVLTVPIGTQVSGLAQMCAAVTVMVTLVWAQRTHANAHRSQR